MSKLSVGKKKGVEWSEVEVTADNKAKCKHCEIVISNKIERIRLHLKKCPIFNAKTDNTEPEEKKTKQEDVPSTSTRTKQPTIKGFVSQTTAEKKAKLDTMVGEFFYANNIPFNVADSKFFKALVSELRPGYQPPSAKTVGGTILQEAAKNVDLKLKEELQNASITLVQDGWSNVKRDAIIGTSVHTGTSSFLLHADEAGPEKKTADFCAKKACDMIEHIKTTFEKEVFAICTDNENKMKSMKEIVKGTHPGIVTVG